METWLRPGFDPGSLRGQSGSGAGSSLSPRALWFFFASFIPPLLHRRYTRSVSCQSETKSRKKRTSAVPKAVLLVGTLIDGTY